MSKKVEPTEYLDEDYLFLILQLVDHPKSKRDKIIFNEIKTEKYEYKIKLFSMQKFSKQLIQQCQKVISKRSGAFVSEDQAELYLESFARLGLAALKIFDKENCKDK